ncbi:MAG: AraC family transcriptional regulator [Clostridia bacterium]|nr:AraC family transcriptional regulator [Clostridia bacterium]
MLKEKVLYQDNLPVNIFVASFEEYPIHYHEELEVIFVLDGTIKVKDGYYTYALKKDDVLIINNRELHSIMCTSEQNVILILQIDLNFFRKYHSNLINPFFITDTSYNADKVNEPLEKLRKLMIRTMVEALNKTEGYQDRIIKYTNDFITELINDFQYFSMDDGKFINEMKNKSNKILAERVNRITNYIYENYSRKLTLQEIAEREHLSVYYLSHVIKEATGLSFQDFLNFVRVEESEMLVLGTDKKISEIAMECGFSAPRYFVKYFTKWFNCHPDEYRELYLDKVRGEETKGKFTTYNKESILSIIKTHFSNVYAHYNNSGTKSIEVIEVDSKGDTRPYLKKSWRTLIVEDINLLVYSEALKQLIEICESLNIKIIKVLNVNISTNIEALINVLDLGLGLIITISYKDVNQVSVDIYQTIKRLSVRREDIEKKLSFEIIVENENPRDVLKKIKERAGSNLDIKISEKPVNVDRNYVYDSVLMVPGIIQRGLLEDISDSYIAVDSMDSYTMMKGDNGIITSAGIKKPSFYAHKMIIDLEGEILASGKNYIILKALNAYKILIYSADSYFEEVYKNIQPPEELVSLIENTQIQNEFIIKINHINGEYNIKKYRISKKNCIFSIYAKLGFPDIIKEETKQIIEWASYPQVFVRETKADGHLEIQSNISEFSAEMIIVEKK